MQQSVENYRIVIMDKHTSSNIAHIREITDSLHFDGKTRALQNNLFSAFSELKFVLDKFEEQYMYILENGSKELDHYLGELNNLKNNGNVSFIIELHNTELSIFIKSFIVLSKSVLDKTIPFFNYKFNTKLNTFGKKGEKLINTLNRNYKESNKLEFIQFIKENKINWLDELINIRDGYIHYSDLHTYCNFSLDTFNKPVTGINNFSPPFIVINGHKVLAVDFLKDTFEKLKMFSRRFLILCGYKEDANRV